MPFGRSSKKIFKSAVYEAAVFVANYASSILITFVGAGFAYATGLVDQEVINFSDILAATAVGSVVVLPVVFGIHVVIDVVKDTDHLDNVMQRMSNDNAHEFFNSDRPSELSSFFRRLWPQISVVAPALIGGLILNCSTEKLIQIAETVGLGVAGAGLIAVPMAIGAREVNHTRKKNRLLRQEATHAHYDGHTVVSIPSFHMRAHQHLPSVAPVPPSSFPGSAVQSPHVIIEHVHPVRDPFTTGYNSARYPSGAPVEAVGQAALADTVDESHVFRPIINS